MTEEIVFGGDADDIPPGTYPGKLVAINTKTSTQFGDFRAWDVELEGGSIVGGSSSLKTGGKSKTSRWTAALLGHVPAKGEAVKLSALIGRPCLAVVVTNDSGWPQLAEILPPVTVITLPHNVSEAEFNKIKANLTPTAPPAEGVQSTDAAQPLDELPF